MYDIYIYIYIRCHFGYGDIVCPRCCAIYSAFSQRSALQLPVSAPQRDCECACAQRSRSVIMPNAQSKMIDAWTVAPTTDHQVPMPEWMARALVQVHEKMESIKQRAMSPDAQLITLRDECKDVLRKAGLLARKFMNSRWIGVHSSNRYGDGVTPGDVLGLISDIFTQGFSLQQLQDPTAFQVPPEGHPRRATLLLFNDEVVDGSGGQLPSYPEPIEAVSVTCGHTSQGFRCFQSASPCDDARFSEDGVLCLRKLAEAQPAYAHAVKEGMQWDVIHWPVEDRWPWTSALLQEAGNASQQIAKAETRLQVLLKIREIAYRNVRLHGEASWEAVERAAVRGGSPFKEELSGLVSYVKELSGGLENPHLLWELRDFAKQLPAVKIVKGAFLHAAATMQVGTEGSTPLFRMACVKAMMACSRQWAPGDCQGLFKTTDFPAMSRSKDSQRMIRDAEQCLIECRRIVDSVGLEGAMRTTMVGLVDCQVVHFVCNRPDASRGIFKSLAQIGGEFVKQIASVSGKSVTSPWAPCPPKAPTVAPAHIGVKNSPPMANGLIPK